MATVSNVTIAALNTLTIASVAVGYTGEPFTVSGEVTRVEFTPEQNFTPIISRLTGRVMTGGCQLWENTPEIVAILWSLPSANVTSGGGSKVLSIDQGDRGNVTLVAVGLAGSAPGTSKTRTFNFANTVISGSVETQMAKEDVSRMNVEFSFLADSAGFIGTMTDTI